MHVCQGTRCCTCTLYVQYVCHFRRISPSVSLSFSLSLSACDVLQILKLTGDFIDQSSIRWEFWYLSVHCIHMYKLMYVHVYMLNIVYMYFSGVSGKCDLGCHIPDMYMTTTPGIVIWCSCTHISHPCTHTQLSTACPAAVGSEGFSRPCQTRCEVHPLCLQRTKANLNETLHSKEQEGVTYTLTHTTRTTHTYMYRTSSTPPHTLLDPPTPTSPSTHAHPHPPLHTPHTHTPTHCPTSPR